MTIAIPKHYLYRLDSSNRITFVSPEWLRFAEANEAPELTEACVVGKSIWDFITGEEVRTLYAAPYRNLRSHRAEIDIPFRCDSPTVIRQMTLTLRSLEAGAIECEGRLVWAQTRESVTVLVRDATRSHELVPICGLCRRVFVQGEWVEVHEAIARRRLFNVAPVPRLEETICRNCKSLVA